MDDIRQRFDKFTPTPEQYKKFNPNPQPEYPVQNITPFPSYEDWKSQVEGGTLPSEFDMRPGEAIPTGLPTEVPGEMPIGIPEQFQPLMDFLGLTDPMELVDVIGDYTDKDLAFIMKLAGVKEEEEEEPLNYFDFTRKQAEDAYASGEWGKDEWDTWKKIQGDRKWLDELVEEEKLTPMAIMKAGKEEEFTTKDEYIEALMGELDWDYDKALNFYGSYITQHPDYPRQ